MNKPCQVSESLIEISSYDVFASDSSSVTWRNNAVEFTSILFPMIILGMNYCLHSIEFMLNVRVISLFCRKRRFQTWTFVYEVLRNVFGLVGYRKYLRCITSIFFPMIQLGMNYGLFPIQFFILMIFISLTRIIQDIVSTHLKCDESRKSFPISFSSFWKLKQNILVFFECSQ